MAKDILSAEEEIAKRVEDLQRRQSPRMPKIDDSIGLKEEDITRMVGNLSRVAAPLEQAVRRRFWKAFWVTVATLVGFLVLIKVLFFM